MAIGQPKTGQTRWGQGRFQPATLIGTGLRMPSGPAVMCAAPKGRTHDCELPIRSSPQKNLASAGPSTHDPELPRWFRLLSSQPV